MSTRARTDLLTTTELYQLDAACVLVSRAFDGAALPGRLRARHGAIGSAA